MDSLVAVPLIIQYFNALAPVVAAFAWPTAFLIAIFIFRRPIKNAISILTARISKSDSGSISILNKAVEVAFGALSDTIEKPNDELSKRAQDGTTFRAVVPPVGSPLEIVSSAFGIAVDRLREIVAESGLTPDEERDIDGFADILLSRGRIDRKQHSAISTLEKLRTIAAGASVQNRLTDSMAAEYVEVVNIVLSELSVPRGG